jgi:hypothetical protein
MSEYAKISSSDNYSNIAYENPLDGSERRMGRKYLNYKRVCM